MSYMQREQEDLFSFFELGEIPTEKDPFCNSTENTAYRESYSDVIPAFFFRDTKCSKKPTKAERKKLRYYYNSTGVILLAKLIIEISVLIMEKVETAICSGRIPASRFAFSSLV